ncbi:hypothetical protein C0992_012392, partial [Termitomyces sp. T32_za158]
HQQELRLLVTKLHASAPLILGLPWLRSTNPWINWQSLTLHFKRNANLSRTPVPFDLPVSPQILQAPGTLGEESPTHSSLRSSSIQLFVINTRLGNSPKIFSALIDSGATETFISDWLALLHQDIAQPLELQLFNGHPAPSGPITKAHSSTLV